MTDPDTMARPPFARRPAARTPAARYVALAGVSLPPVAVGAHLLGASPAGILAALALYVGASGLAVRHLAGCYPHSVLGACNVVTQARLAAVAMLAGAAVAPAAPAGPAAFGLAVAALCLDGVDGWLARRAGLASAFGARFDMEVDAALGAVLALTALRAGTADGPLLWACLLVLGLSRYAFVAAAAALPWLGAPLPERRSRKVVCVVQIATLAALLLPLPTGAATGLAAGAAGALVWSFARDVAWLARAAA